GGRLVREPGPPRLSEDRSYPLRIRLEGALLRPPGGQLFDPLLGAAIAVGPRWPRELRREVSLRGLGRQRIDPARLVIRDPLSLWTRELCSDSATELVVLPRIEPVQILQAAGEKLGA